MMLKGRKKKKRSIKGRLKSAAKKLLRREEVEVDEGPRREKMRAKMHETKKDSRTSSRKHWC